MQNEFSSEKKTNNIDLSQIKDKIILSEFARSALGLKISKTKTMCCHLHKDATPSLHFNDEKKFYYCFGCHKSGDVFSLIQEIKNCSFLDSIKFAASYAGINVEEALSDYNFLRNSSELKEKKDNLFKIMEDICLYFENKLYEFGKEEEDGKNDQQDALKYLASRKIDEKMIKKFRIGYCPENIEDLIQSLKNKYHSSINLLLDSGVFRKSQKSYYLNQKNSGFYSILSDRIIFPIFDKFNKVIAFGGRIFKNQNERTRKFPKYINASDSLIFKKNEVLYGENFSLASAKLKNQMILVEGYLDVIMMHSAGFKNCAAPMGTAVSEFQIKSLWSLVDEISCCMDGDSAGFKSMISVLEKTLPIIHAEKFINFVFLEKGSDPADLIEQNRIDELKDFFENKKRFPASIIFNLCLGKYKNFTTETIAAVRSKLNSYLEKISDSIIKDEYKLYFEKKIDSLTKKIDQRNQNSEEESQKEISNNFKKDFGKYNKFTKFKKNELTIFDEIFFYFLVISEKFSDSSEFSRILNSNLDLIKKFFKNNQEFLEILESKKLTSVKNSINFLKKSEKYAEIDFEPLLNQVSRKISSLVSQENPEKILKKFVILKIQIIDLKNKQRFLESKIASNDPALTFEDFENFSKIQTRQKELQSELDEID